MHTTLGVSVDLLHKTPAKLPNMGEASQREAPAASVIQSTKKGVI